VYLAARKWPCCRRSSSRMPMLISKARRAPMNVTQDVMRAYERGETKGFIKILVDRDSKQMLGASLLGLEGDEVTHCVLDVMYARAPYTMIQRAMHIHPTVSEFVPTMMDKSCCSKDRAALSASKSKSERNPMKSERDGINPTAEPSGTRSVECLVLGGWWLHLRRRTECGHVGCCGSSPNQHASRHSAAAGHPIIASFELGEHCFFVTNRQSLVVPSNLSPARSFARLARVRWINRRPDRPEQCLQTGKRCSTNRMRRNPFLAAVKLGVRAGTLAASSSVQSR
jgi:Pyridine nucleotide-disulphide oxidoreductase, dimerisation domain/Zn-finger in ubiquitin-hydrolases and other protein